jgi:hypothetical protein
MLVELDVFSGRPNPRWELDEHADQQLRELHRRLAPSVSPPAEPPGLGYRGFRYTLDGVTWWTWNGSVVGPDRVLNDPDRSVERMLANQVPDLYGGLRSRIEGDLKRGT